MSDVPLLADLLRDHLTKTGQSARSLSEKIDASYPSVLAWLGKGGVPRKAEHREALRRELAVPADVFARILAASSKEQPIESGDGPADLRQILLRYLGERGLTERTFSDIARIPYATLMGITRRNAVPRAATLAQLAQAMGVAEEVLREAAAATRGEAEAAGHAAEVIDEPARPDTRAIASDRIAAPAAEAEPSQVQPADAQAAATDELARIASERVASSGMSAAAYARSNGLPYLALSRLLATGQLPEDAAVVDQLRAAFPAPAAGRAAPPRRAQAEAEPAERPAVQTTTALQRAGDTSAAGHALQDALRRLMRERGWTQQKLAEAAALAVPTVAKLLRGELPSRVATHQKLRELLGLDEAAYAELLPPEPAEGEPSPAKPAQTETGRLARAIRDLDGGQRAAVWQLVKTFRRT
jgi:transcriptional regulator with XRE-family HTH domain